MGRKRFYMSCVVIFTVSSFLCGFAHSLGTLVFFRILQGAGGGGLQPSEQAILNDTFSLAKRGMAFAVYGIAVVVAPTIGPWLGGWITDNYSWRWIFYINVPVGVLSIVLTYLLVSDPPYMKRVNLKQGFRIDYIGLGLITLGLASMQIVLDKGQRKDWFSSSFIVTFMVLTVIGLVAGVLWELHTKDPVVDFKMLKNRNFAIATTAMFFLGFVLYSTTMLIPQMLQETYSATLAETAGLALSPGGALIMVMMPVVGFLVTKVDTRFLITFGCSISASRPFLVMSGWNLQLDFRHAVLGRMMQTFGLAFLFIPINVSAFAYVPRELTNMGTGHHQSFAQHRRQRRSRNGYHIAGTPYAVAPGAIDGARQSLESSPEQYGQRQRHSDDDAWRFCGAGHRASPRHDPEHGAASSRHDGFSRQF